MFIVPVFTFIHQPLRLSSLSSVAAIYEYAPRAVQIAELYLSGNLLPATLKHNVARPYDKLLHLFGVFPVIIIRHAQRSDNGIYT